MKSHTPAQQTIEGTISLTTKGIGYVRNKELATSIEIDTPFLNTALHGDQVRVQLHSTTQDKELTGEIIEIIQRAKAGFAGVLEKDGPYYFLVPSDTKMYTDILIPEDKLKDAHIGQKVFCVITDWKDPKKSPIGEIVEVLGIPRENNAEMRAIALEKGFSTGFPDDVEKEAAELLSEDMEVAAQGRRDFRGTTTFTIDPEDAKDFDDALSFRVLENGHYEIGIHIADVSHYLKPGSALDREAIKRQTSVYLVDRTIPMLPEILSNDLCSLKPNVDRLVMSAVFIMDVKGTVYDAWYGKAIIHSDKRFTYEEAQAVLDTGGGAYHNELTLLNTIAKALTKQRFAAGAISLDQEEVKFKLDTNGVPIAVYKKIRQDTNKLIEEFMLLANRKVAEFVDTETKKERIFVYRIHDLPDKEKTENLVTFLKKLGYNVKTHDGIIPSSEINILLESLEGKEERETIHTAIIRSMAKAIYSTKNIGHFGLAFEYYTHFTSPIRRYPDVIVHRLFEEYLHGRDIDKKQWESYEQMCTLASQREKEAADAERASVKYKQIEYMSLRIGQAFDGVITGVSEWGVYAEEKASKCEGMIRMKDLGDDFYELDEKHMRIVGKKTKKTFQIGDKVKIRVTNADLNKKVIDYAFV
ncbi:MAG: ribonuclease R [Candidatus Pacebacteria bacterium]|nr:ribonuclease R [Candidatus Paceibacterota bacterium]